MSVDELMLEFDDAERAVIITALPAEHSAVLEQLHAPVEVVHPQGTVYDVGAFTSLNTQWMVAVTQIGVGNPAAALESERAISSFRPRVVLFVGVAGGLKNVAVGDVVAATRVYGYEFGKSEKRFLPRPDVGEAAYRLIQRAMAEARKKSWTTRIRGALTLNSTPVRPRAFVGPIAAGEKVVASTRGAVYAFLQAHYGDALAVEMEGRGFLTAVHANAGVDGMVIRGISDVIDGKSASDAAGAQELASRVAIAFALEVLSKLGSEPVKTGQYEIVLTLTIDEEDKARVDALVAHLRKLARDPKLTVIRTRRGSLVLTIKGSWAGFERLMKLFQSGELSRELGTDVQRLTWDDSTVPSQDVLIDGPTSTYDGVAFENRPAHTGSRRLYVGNLPYTATDEMLRDLFSRAGVVETVRVMRDVATGRHRGFAFVQMKNAEDAQRAVADFHGHLLDGRPLAVTEARPRPEHVSSGHSDFFSRSSSDRDEGPERFKH